MRRILRMMVLLLLCSCFWCIIGFQFALMVSKNKDNQINKFRMYFILMKKWMLYIYTHNSINDKLVEMGYKHVAIYGMGEIGRLLFMQLEEKDIIVDYAIEKKYVKMDIDLPLFNVIEKLPKTDAIIVTPIWDYKTISSDLSKKIDCPIISIEDIL